MNRLLFLIISVFLSACTGEQAPISSVDAKEELMATIHQFNEAFKTGAVDQLETMITDHYQHTNGNSKVISKQVWLNYLKKRKKELDSGQLNVRRYEMLESQLQFYGNTAILTARIVVESERQGASTTNEYRVTNVWVKEGRQWKRAGFHDGKIQ